jgi:3'-phosphoadenosine 5'-phosphosulfate sulfotransferase (PAPS reductase)/FAD synthetase
MKYAAKADDNPYVLPEGNVAIAFSGGRTSAYMLHQIIQANGLDEVNSDRVVVSFHNTGREMPETLDFVQECGDRWGVKIVWLEYRADAPRFEVVSHNSASRNGEPFEALIRKRKSLPNRVARFCTAEMKVHCSSRYLKSIGWQRWNQAVGIRADEPRRLKGAPPRERYTLWHPLAAANVSRHEVSEFWARKPFDLRLPNVNGRTQLGNCDGCFLKSEAARAALARDYPERAAWWDRMEKLAQSISSRPDNARFREDGTWAEHMRFIDRQSDWIFDTEGALCQANDGECTG